MPITSGQQQSSTPNGEFRLMMPSGFIGKIGGTGMIYGTNGSEFITLADAPGEVGFDPSFNRGGDIIGLPGVAANYSISLFGSSALLEHDSSRYTIPIGSTGVQLLFADGIRTLVYSDGQTKIGSQIVGSAPSTVNAPSESQSPTLDQVPHDEAVVFLSPGASASLGGNYRVFGTEEAETVSYIGGDLILDPSFNRGGDTLYLDGPPSAYSAYRSGSLIVITTPNGHIMVPIGTAGMAISFDGDEHILRFDSASLSVMLGDISLSGSGAENPVSLGGIGTGADATVTLDVGTGSVVETINLDAGLSYILADDATEDTNVVITGFSANDQIHVTGAAAFDYNFTSSDADGDSLGDDLLISFSNGNIFNLITILDAVPSTSIIADLTSAKAAVGYDFISFPDAPAAGIQAGPVSTAESTVLPATEAESESSSLPAPHYADSSISLDVGTGAVVMTLNLEPNMSYVLTDDTDADTNVVIYGFDSNDLIEVFGANPSDYNFSSTDADGDSFGDDLKISFSDGASFTLVTLIDAVSPNDLVANLATAEAAIGHNFIAFG